MCNDVGLTGKRIQNLSLNFYSIKCYSREYMFYYVTTFTQEYSKIAENTHKYIKVVWDFEPKRKGKDGGNWGETDAKA